MQYSGLMSNFIALSSHGPLNLSIRDIFRIRNLLLMYLWTIGCIKCFSDELLVILSLKELTMKLIWKIAAGFSWIKSSIRINSYTFDIFNPYAFEISRLETFLHAFSTFFDEWASEFIVRIASSDSMFRRNLRSLNSSIFVSFLYITGSISSMLRQAQSHGLMPTSSQVLVLVAFSLRRLTAE